MPYIGHAPTNAGQFVLLDDLMTKAIIHYDNINKS